MLNIINGQAGSQQIQKYSPLKVKFTLDILISSIVFASFLLFASRLSSSLSRRILLYRFSLPVPLDHADSDLSHLSHFLIGIYSALRTHTAFASYSEGEAAVQAIRKVSI